jgi:ribosomal protein S8
MKVMEPNEIKRELKKLNDLYNSGYIQSFEFEDRKSKLNALSSLPSNSKKSSSKSSSSNPAKSKERVVRLFLSSTFRDMQQERDELIKLTFPTLKQYCAERGVFFNEIDLR